MKREGLIRTPFKEISISHSVLVKHMWYKHIAPLLWVFPLLFDLVPWNYLPCDNIKKKTKKKGLYEQSQKQLRELSGEQNTQNIFYCSTSAEGTLDARLKLLKVPHCCVLVALGDKQMKNVQNNNTTPTTHFKLELQLM